MQKNFFVIIATVPLLIFSSQCAQAQSPDVEKHRFELGGQFSVINTPIVRGILPTFPIVCVRAPCIQIIPFETSREVEPGFGGRIGYNINKFFAVEAEVNYFPRERRFDGERAIQGLLGVKAGRRFEKVGVFGKVRPGFLSSRTSDFRDRTDVACITIFPPPAACFEETSRRATNLAFDLGGVVELYPTSRIIVRFDAGDTIVRLGQRSFIVPSPTTTSGFVVTAPAETTHNFQGSAGIGFRF
jgi:Outer membrane protein beta-barrel domain